MDEMNFKKKKNIPVFKITVSEDFCVPDGIKLISLVDEPAIDAMGMVFAKKRRFKYNSRPECHPNCYCEIVDGSWFVNAETVCDVCLKMKDKYDRSIKRIKERNRRKAINKGIIDSSAPGSSSFNSHLQFAKDDYQQIIMGPVCIPDIEIYRKAQKDKPERYVVFDADTIKLLRNKFNKGNNNTAFNLQHSSQMVDAYIMESWIIEHEYYDKTTKYNLHFPVGTWMLMVKIEDKEFFNEQVLKLKRYGFSIEALLGQKLFDMSSEELISENFDNEIEEEDLYDEEDFDWDLGYDMEIADLIEIADEEALIEVSQYAIQKFESENTDEQKHK